MEGGRSCVGMWRGAWCGVWWLRSPRPHTCAYLRLYLAPFTSTCFDFGLASTCFDDMPNCQATRGAYPSTPLGLRASSLHQPESPIHRSPAQRCAQRPRGARIAAQVVVYSDAAEQMATSPSSSGVELEAARWFGAMHEDGALRETTVVLVDNVLQVRLLLTSEQAAAQDRPQRGIRV